MNLVCELWAAREIDAKVEEVAERIGLPSDLLDRNPHRMSGGPKTRVGIVSAIVSPALLVLDEAAAALDVSVQTVILQLLDRLKREFAMSFLFVSRDLNVGWLVCDRVLVANLGQIVEPGPTKAVFRAPAHPYTRALIASLTGRLTGRRGSAAVMPVGGDPEGSTDTDPNHCRMLPRCPRVLAHCGETAPVLEDLGQGRRVACQFPTMVQHVRQ